MRSTCRRTAVLSCRTERNTWHMLIGEAYALFSCHDEEIKTRRGRNGEIKSSHAYEWHVVEVEEHPGGASLISCAFSINLSGGALPHSYTCLALSTPLSQRTPPPNPCHKLCKLSTPIPAPRPPKSPPRLPYRLSSPLPSPCSFPGHPHCC